MTKAIVRSNRFSDRRFVAIALVIKNVRRKSLKRLLRRIKIAKAITTKKNR